MTPRCVWSQACMVFEQLTGDYLFRPSSRKNKGVPQDQAHIALMIATLGQMPKRFYKDGKYSREIFNKSGKLQNTEVPEYYPIDSILTEEYGFNEKEAGMIQDFLLPMLNYDPAKRISAGRALQNPWLWS